MRVGDGGKGREVNPKMEDIDTLDEWENKLDDGGEGGKFMGRIVVECEA